jgi:hypothetical protein
MSTESEVSALSGAVRRCSIGGHRHESGAAHGTPNDGSEAVTRIERVWRPVRRRYDPEFEVVWNGIGPLPGAGAAAGLGSTLSGMHFSIGKRG